MPFLRRDGRQRMEHNVGSDIAQHVQLAERGDCTGDGVGAALRVGQVEAQFDTLTARVADLAGRFLQLVEAAAKQAKGRAFTREGQAGRATKPRACAGYEHDLIGELHQYDPLPHMRWRDERAVLVGDAIGIGGLPILSPDGVERFTSGGAIARRADAHVSSRRAVAA